MNIGAKFLGLLSVLILLSFGAFARETVPIVEYNDVAVTTGSGKPATADQVRDAITEAARVNKWEISRGAGQELLLATLYVRGKHTVAVSIPYSAERFSIKYKDSVNMKYSLSKLAPNANGSTDLSRISAPTQSLPPDTPVIHPAYNRWVQTLLQSIHLELKKL